MEENDLYLYISLRQTTDDTRHTTHDTQQTTDDSMERDYYI